MTLLDEVAERVEIVEERVRIDLAPERQQLRLDVQPLQVLAALPIALPLRDQKQRFVDVRDERHRGDDRDHRHRDRSPRRVRIAGTAPPIPIAPSPVNGIVNRQIRPTSSRTRCHGCVSHAVRS